jgi:exonuclease SbcC
MRPLLLELSGFTAFREPETIEFGDAPYFALVGPTGSGKSTIIDAMVFALYGAVPRIGLGSVLPVISQGKQEARVRLDFSVGDRTYTAVRVVRKLGEDRATTKEARLEYGGETLAGDADGVTREVERLLGLKFEEFTRCVVLPQGDFARFMHDKPAARQDLLVRLLGLDVYERMAQRANQRASGIDGELAIQRRRLEEDLAFATDEALTDLRARLAKLEALRERIEEQEPELETLRETVKAARAEADAAARAADSLAAIRIPEGIEQLATAATDARALVEAAESLAEAAEKTLRDAESARATLPERAVVERALDANARRRDVAAELEAARTAATAAEKAATKSAAATTKAQSSAEKTQRDLDAAKLQHRAHDLARELVAGEPCPVCEQTVHDLPAAATPADLSKAEAAAAKSLDAARAAERAHADAQNAHAAASSRVETLSEQLGALEATIAAAFDAALGSAVPPRAREDAATEALGRIVAAEDFIANARTAASAARKRATNARAAVQQVDAALKNARRALDAARDGVAALGPPAVTHDDLAADWRALAGWAAEQIGAQRTAATAARERASAAEDAGKAIVARQRDACAEAGIEDVTAPRDDCIKAVERLRGNEQQLELQIESAKQLREEIAALEERSAVARALGTHLKASGFERWVLRQALSTLVDGATSILLDLTSGGYSFALDKHFNFAVVDHRNADLQRPARTLSGGETFLASLALALALSDRIAQLSANTSVRLESIFLDEGFGTLDPETLETVHSAIENLAASNRMVGLVTHVRELAERVPVRFEVTKGPTTSRVEKVLV